MDGIANLATQAAVLIASNTTANQKTYASTFGQLPEVAATPNATILQGFAQALLSNMAAQASSGNMGADRTASLLVLANASGLRDAEQLFSTAFSQVRLPSLTVYTCFLGRIALCRNA